MIPYSHIYQSKLITLISSISLAGGAINKCQFNYRCGTDPIQIDTLNDISLQVINYSCTSTEKQEVTLTFQGSQYCSRT